jgi:hypothetical protein
MKLLKLNKYKVLVISFLVLISIILLLWIYNFYDYSVNKNKANGFIINKNLVLEDEFIEIYDNMNKVYTEIKNPEEFFGYKIKKKWYSIIEENKLKNGIELILSNHYNPSIKDTIVELKSKLSIMDIKTEEFKGCNDKSYYKISNNNVIPINYYFTKNSNNILIIKHYNQLPYNKYQLSFNNICLKN